MQNKTLFQLCQKIVVINEADQTVLLAKRHGEADFDGIYSLIGGKAETTDGGIVEGMQREKNEEIGADAKLSVYPYVSWDTYYTKKDGSGMFLPHYYASYVGGEIQLNADEYESYQWVEISDLADFEPKIDTILPAVEMLMKLKTHFTQPDFVLI